MSMQHTVYIRILLVVGYVTYAYVLCYESSVALFMSSKSTPFKHCTPKIKKPVHPSKKPANEQVQRQFLKVSKKPVMYQ